MHQAQGKTSAKLVVVESTYPMNFVCIDFLFLEMSAGGYEHILVITDNFTEYAHAIPTKNRSVKTTARVLFDNFICHYDFPARLHSDQCPSFESEVKELCSIARIDKSRTTPYHPMENGKPERFNQTLLNMFSTLGTTRSPTGSCMCILWSMHINLHAMKLLAIRPIT